MIKIGVAINLIRAGIKNFILVNFDKIEETNLNINFFIEKIDKKEFKPLLIENYSTKYIVSANGIGRRDLKNLSNIFN